MMKPIISFASAVVALGSNLALSAEAAPKIPFPEALAAADVRVSEIDPKNVKDNLHLKGVVVGNGEMNVIVYVAEKDLMLRVTKNDVWDGRIDTSEDPALPVVNPATHSLKREKPGNPPSWSKPYPCGVPTADIKLAGAAAEKGWDVGLNLQRAVATASVSGERNLVRALGQSNVVYINSKRPLELVGVEQKFLPAATSGTGGEGIKWLRQSIPGDDDIKGMEVYLVAGEQGDRKAVAVVTSNDSPEPLKRGIQLVKETLAKPEADVLAQHEALWADFWAQSGIQLSEKQFQNWWYRMVYYFRCFSKKGATGVGLKASLDGLGGWHNSYKFNYNIQQTYYSGGPINHPELVEPIIDVLANYWPRARWFAKTCFVGCEGAFVHSDVFHPHEPDPAQCKTKNQHQFAYIPFGYSLGMMGHIAFLMWEYQQYQPNAEYLKAKTYPMLRDIGLFYCSFLEHCKTDENGKYLVGPSYFPEDGYFGQDNGAYDLPYINYGLKAARDAAKLLNTDAALVQRIDAVLAKMPYFELIADPEQGGQKVVNYYRGYAKVPNDDRHGSLIQAVFPAGQVTWFSPEDEKELFKRSINLVGRITTHANSPVTLNISRARLGLTEDALKNIRIDFTENHKENPNGLFSWKAHGSYISEQVGVSRLITELLLQSVENVIRIFPAWPADKDAAFAGLRAQGGFLVSAKLAGGKISDVKLESTVGGQARMINPWPGKALDISEARSGRNVAATEAKGIVQFSTTPGAAYLIAPNGAK